MPGIEICELLPQHRPKVADKLAIVRSVTSPLGEHGSPTTTCSPATSRRRCWSTRATARSCRTSAAAGTRCRRTSPIPDVPPTAGAGFLGTAHQPFAVGGDPAKPDFRVRDLDFYPGVTTGRMDRRREFLAQFDRFQAERGEPQPPTPTFEQAYRLVTSPEAKQAFDLSEEKPAVRARYGPRTLGQSCLLARRLVERGVAVRHRATTPGWDTHDDLVLRLRKGYAGAKVGVGLIPTFDLAFAALVGDLADRGLLDETLVIAMGEFGRTPKLNTPRRPRPLAARLQRGAGRRRRQGRAGDRRQRPRRREPGATSPVTPADLAAHDLHAARHRPDQRAAHVRRPAGAVNQGGKVIRELLRMRAAVLGVMLVAGPARAGRAADHGAGICTGRQVGARRLASRRCRSAPGRS